MGVGWGCSAGYVQSTRPVDLSRLHFGQLKKLAASIGILVCVLKFMKALGVYFTDDNAS
jgi:hypothetical protein